MENADCRRKVEIFLTDPSNSNLHSEIIEMVKNSDVRERSYQFADQLIEEAKLAIESLEDNECKRALLLLADFIISRNK